MLCRQVKFIDEDGVMHGGILVANGAERNLICGCCGGVYDQDDMEWIHIEEYKTWVDISNEIMGD